MVARLSQQVGILTVGRVFAYVVMFFVPLVNVRALTVEEYGYYRQFWLLVETLVPLLIMSFPRSLLYYFPRAEGREEKSVYLTQTLAFLAAMSLVAWAIYTVMGLTLGAGLGDLVRSYYWRLTLFTACFMIAQFLDSLFLAERQVMRQSVYQATYSSVQALMVIIVAWVTRSVSDIIWALMFYSLARFAVAAGYALKNYRPSLRLVSLPTIREQLSFAVPLGLAGTALLLIAQTDKFIINRFLGREAFAIYSIGAFQLPFVNIIRSSITDVTFPLMAQYQKAGDTNGMIDLWKRITVKTAVLFFPIFVGLVILAKPFIVILFTEQYANAAPIFIVYLFVFLRSVIEFGGIVTAFKQQAYMARVFGVALVANLVLSIVLFKVMGRIGVPIATVISLYGLSTVMITKSARLLGSRVREVLPWGGLAYRFIVACVAGLPLLYLTWRVSIESLWMLLGGLALYAVIYLAIAFPLKLLKVSDLRALIGKS